MSLTALDVKKAVCAFVHRSTTALTSPDSVDMAYLAINNAQIYAQRMVDFEFNRVTATVACTTAAGGSLTAAKLYGTSTDVTIKKVLKPFLTLATDASGTPIPVDFWGPNKWVERAKRQYSNLTTSESNLSIAITSDIIRRLVVVQEGQLLFATPSSDSILGASYNIHFKAIKWLPRYSAGTETDFLIDYAFDWLVYRSVYELNFYLKEDERVIISDKLITDAWNALVHWNGTLVNENTDDSNLD